jgi:hypothetical protein
MHVVFVALNQCCKKREFGQVHVTITAFCCLNYVLADPASVEAGLGILSFKKKKNGHDNLGTTVAVAM